MADAEIGKSVAYLVHHHIVQALAQVKFARLSPMVCRRNRCRPCGVSGLGPRCCGCGWRCSCWLTGW